MNPSSRRFLCRLSLSCCKTSRRLPYHSYHNQVTKALAYHRAPFTCRRPSRLLSSAPPNTVTPSPSPAPSSTPGPTMDQSQDLEELPQPTGHYKDSLAQLYALYEQKGKEKMGTLTPQRVLEITDYFKTTLSDKQLATAIGQLRTAVKETGTKHDELLSNPLFQQLCELVVEQARFMTNNDLVSVLSAMCLFRVPEDMTVMRVLLGVSKNKINSFDAFQMASFSGVLGRLEKNQEVKLLLKSVSLLAEPMVAEIYSEYALSNLVLPLWESDLASKSLMIKYENRMLAILKTPDYIGADEAMYIIKNCNNAGLELRWIVEVAGDLLVVTPMDIDRQASLFVGMLRSFGQVNRSRTFFQTLLRRLGDYLAETVGQAAPQQSQQVSSMVIAYCDQNFVSGRLLDAVSQGLVSGRLQLPSLPVLHNFLKGFATFHYRPANFQLLFDQLLAALDGLLSQLGGAAPDFATLKILGRTAEYLAVFEFFPPPLLRIVYSQLSIDLANSQAESDKRGFFFSLDAVYRCLKVDMGEDYISQTGITYGHPLAAEPAQKPFPRQQSILKEVDSTLRQVVQDHQTKFDADVTLDLGYHVDFVIEAVVKESNPKAPKPIKEWIHEKMVEYADWLMVNKRTHPPILPTIDRQHVLGEVRYAVLVVAPSWTSLGTKRVKGQFVVKMRHLEKLGYKLVVIKPTEWNTLFKRDMPDYMKKTLGLPTE